MKTLLKVLLIVRKDLQIMFTDTTFLMIMIATPLALTFVMSAAFGGFSSTDDTPISGIRVLVVNQDQGGLMGNFGEIFQNVLVTPPAEMLDKLIDAEALTDPEAARARVRGNLATAAIIIPPDFSARLNSANPDFGLENKVQVEVFRNAGDPIQAGIISSIVTQFVNGFAAASVGPVAAIQVDPAFVLKAQAIAEDVQRQLQENPPITVTNIAGGQDVGVAGVSLISFFAPSMAVFFLNFAATSGIINIMEEREHWTLQRMLVTPTRRLAVLMGKFGASYLTGVTQLTVLIIATSLFGPLFNVSKPVWGTNVPALAAMVLIVSGAAVGLGTIIIGLAKNRQQASVLMQGVLILSGLIGGAFFADMSGSAPFGPLSYASINYWANNGFFSLARGEIPTASMAALIGLSVVFFGAGIVLFTRKLDV